MSIEQVDINALEEFSVESDNYKWVVTFKLGDDCEVVNTKYGKKYRIALHGLFVNINSRSFKFDIRGEYADALDAISRAVGITKGTKGIDSVSLSKIEADYED